MHDAGPALAGVATDMGSCQAQAVADEIDEQCAPLDLTRYRLAVHLQTDAGHIASSLNAGQPIMRRNQPFFFSFPPGASAPASSVSLSSVSAATTVSGSSTAA